MKRTDAVKIEAIRTHAQTHPEDDYAKIAATFGVSVVTVKRHCADLGRGKHWRRGRKQASPDVNKFWLAIDRTADGCWLWKGCRNNHGYGFVHFDGVSQAAHRVAYTLTHGAIADGLELDHRCRNRACCNPEHLEAITHAENMERVRLSQPPTLQAYLHDSPPVIDPDPSIDTRRDGKREDRSGVAPTVVKEDRLHPKSSAPGGVSVSTDPGRHIWDPLVAGMTRELEHGLRIDGEDDQRGIGPKQLGATKGWATLRVFGVASRPNSDGIWEQILARSAEDAKAMFASVWGRGYDVNVQEIGYPRDEEAVRRGLAEWREKLSERHERWMATDEGKRCFERVRAENQKKWYAELEQQLLDNEAQWQEDCQERLRVKRPTEFRRPHQIRASRWREDDSEADEFVSAEMEEVDY
jgi:hypothetical protein